MKELKKYQFINWAKNLKYNVAHYYQPQNEAELISVIKNNKKIKVIGTGHSWSNIHETQDAMLNLDLYNKILSINKEKKTVCVQAGIKIWQLNEQLDKEGLALINLGSIDQQSIAGAVSTSTHGSGINFQILGSQILEFSLIKANGEKIIINKEKDLDLFKACVVNLGALGIISEIVLKVTDAYNLHDYTTTVPFDTVIANLEQYLSENDHFKMWWLPPTNEVVVYTYKRTQEAVNDSKFRQILQERILSVYIYRFVVFIAKIFPFLAKFMNKLLTQNMSGPLDRIEKSYKVFIVPEPPLHRETEWSFDIKNAKEILSAYKKFITENKYNLNFIQEIRFTKGDDFWLSACYERDSLWLGLYAYEHENWDKVLLEYETFARNFNGRPHWGKEFTRDKNYLKQQYPKYEDFIKLKNEMDPNGKFDNAYLNELFNYHA